MISLKRSIAVLCIVSLAALAGCKPPTQEQFFDFDAPPRRGIYLGKTPEEIRSTLSGKTLVASDPQHGTQIEYLASNGRTFLWYPGTTRSLPARWDVRTGEFLGHETTLVCFLYPSQSYNPVTKQFGGDWECLPSLFYGEDIEAMLAGDTYNLSSGRTPKALPPRTELTIEEVNAYIGRSRPVRIVAQHKDN